MCGAWGCGRCFFSRNLRPRHRLGNVSGPGPSPAAVFSGDSEEGGLFLDSPSEAGKQTPPPPGPPVSLGRKWAGSLAATWTFQVSSEGSRAEGWMGHSDSSPTPSRTCTACKGPPALAAPLTLCLQCLLPSWTLPCPSEVLPVGAAGHLCGGRAPPDGW